MIQDLSSRGTAKKNKRMPRTSDESDREEKPQYEGGGAKKSEKKVQKKQVKGTKKINHEIGRGKVFLEFAKQYRYFICQSEPIFDQTVTKNFVYI